MNAELIYTGGAQIQRDIYRQFVGMDTLAAGGAVKENIFSTDTSIAVGEDTLADTELIVTLEVSGDTTY